MNLSQNKKLMLIPIFLILFLGLIFFNEMKSFTEIHEITHMKIATNYGCQDWTINNGFRENNFICHHYEGDYDQNQEMLLHSINEIVSYNLISLATLIMIVTLLLIISMFVCVFILKS